MLIFSRMTHVTGVDGLRFRNGEVLPFYQQSLCEVRAKRVALDSARKMPTWRRILGYPLIFMALLALTAMALVCVIFNVMQIMAGFRQLPSNTKASQRSLNRPKCFVLN